MFQLFNTLILLIFFTIVGVVGAATGSSVDAASKIVPSPLAYVIFGIQSIYALIVFVPTLAVTVRRLHDAGQSGWMYLLVLIPLVGGIVLFVFTVLDSQFGANKWGPNPKGVTVTPAPF